MVVSACDALAELSSMIRCGADDHPDARRGRCHEIGSLEPQ